MIRTRTKVHPASPLYGIVLTREDDDPALDVFWDGRWYGHTRGWRCFTFTGARFKRWRVERAVSRQLRRYHRARARFCRNA